MAKTRDAKLAKRKAKKDELLPLGSTNYKIILLGLAVIVLGYVALSMDPWDGPMALVVAPVLLVVGYCVIIPFGIIYRKKEAPQVPDQGARLDSPV